MVRLARGWKDDPDTLPILKGRARLDESEEVRSKALRELMRGWKDDLEVVAMAAAQQNPVKP